MPSNVIYYIAASLDGYIADEGGSVAFLDSLGPQPDMGYADFLDSVGTLILGATTYRQIITELSPDAWPYPGKRCYVYTHTPPAPDPNVHFTALPPADLVRQIRAETPGDIWLVGGGSLAAQFLTAAQIDRLQLTLFPILLGSGIPLFPPAFPRTDFTLTTTRTAGDLVELTYERKN